MGAMRSHPSSKTSKTMFNDHVFKVAGWPQAQFLGHAFQFELVATVPESYSLSVLQERSYC